MASDNQFTGVLAEGDRLIRSAYSRGYLAGFETAVSLMLLKDKRRRSGAKRYSGAARTRRLACPVSRCRLLPAIRRKAAQHR